MIIKERIIICKAQIKACEKYPSNTKVIMNKESIPLKTYWEKQLEIANNIIKKET